MQGRVTISHGYALGGVSEATTRRLVEELAELDVAMATVAPSVDTALPLVDLTGRGVRVGLGEDGQRDYWSPYGNADMLDRTWQLAFTIEVPARRPARALPRRRDVGRGRRHRPDRAAARVDGRPAGSRRRRPRRPASSSAGESVAACVMDRSRDRTVVHAGRVVAEALELVQT